MEGTSLIRITKFIRFVLLRPSCVRPSFLSTAHLDASKVLRFLCQVSCAEHAAVVRGSVGPPQVAGAGIDFTLVRTGAVEDDEGLAGAALQAVTAGERPPAAKVRQRWASLGPILHHTASSPA